MTLNNYDIDFYLNKIRNNEPFSIGMYGDGEWQCIFNQCGLSFAKNCEDTIYSPELSKQMYDSLSFNEENFYFAAPDTFKIVPQYFGYEKTIDEYFPNKVFYEKNVWNKAMCKAELYPVISEFRKHNVCIIGNKMLKGLTFLNYDKFIEVSYPNCFGELESVVKQCLEYGKEGIYIFACGIPATLFVQALHGKIPNSWFLDLGSIWDGFVGIGGQRPTRRQFYLNQELWKEWVDKNLKEIEWSREMPLVEFYGRGSKDIINGQKQS